MTPPGSFHGPVVVGIVLLLTVVSMVGPAAAQDDATPAFIVDVNADGSAQVHIRSTFDLQTDAEQAAFQTLEADEQAQADARARFLARLQAVASDAANATGREMRVTDATLDLQRTADNETGVITLTVTWEGLAAVSGETLTVTEPFASGFEPDRPFVLRAPDGYVIASATPEPDATDERSATWDAGTSLTGFEVVLEPAGTPAVTTTRSEGQPGFGVLVALLALLAAVSIARRFG